MTRILAALLIAMPTAVSAHDWYDRACCSSADCYPVEESAITPVNEGWRVNATGEILPYGSPKVRITPPVAGSPWHRCSYGGKKEAKTICIYVPGMGS